MEYNVDLTTPHSFQLSNHMFVDWTPNIEHEYIIETGSIGYGDLNILNPESLQKCLKDLNDWNICICL